MDLSLNTQVNATGHDKPVSVEKKFDLGKEKAMLQSRDSARSAMKRK